MQVNAVRLLLNKPFHIVPLTGMMGNGKALLTHNAIRHQSSLKEAGQHVGGVMLVVGDAGQAGVEGHHQKSELDQGPQQPSAMPGETRLQVELCEKE